MRHRKSFNHLGRQTGHRKSMLANMASSLILHKRIKTTTAKAKALRVFVEPLITKSKDDSTNSRRVVFSYLQSKEAVTELFREVSPKIANRPGGYTRILKTGNRLGDNADMCVIELVDYNENLLSARSEEAAKSGRKRRRGGKKKAEDTQASIAPEVQSADAVPEIKEEAAKNVAADTVADEVSAPEATEVSSETTEEKITEEKAPEAKAETPVEEAKEGPKVETKAEESGEVEAKEEQKKDESKTEEK